MKAKALVEASKCSVQEACLTPVEFHAAWRMTQPVLATPLRNTINLSRFLGPLQEEQSALIRDTASDLLSLPWEIMHDDVGFLSQAEKGVRVRRLPNRKERTT